MSPNQNKTQIHGPSLGAGLLSVKHSKLPADDLISILAPGATYCPDKSIPGAKWRHRKASDILKGSCLIRVSASTNREERNDSGKRWR